MTRRGEAAVVYWYGEEDLPRDGGGIRALAWVEALRSLGYSARIHALNAGGPPTSAPRLLTRLKRTLAPMPFSRQIEVPAADLVVGTVPGTFSSLGRTASPRVPTIFDWMDRWSTNAWTMAGASPMKVPGGAIQSLSWRHRERRLPVRAEWNTFAGFDDFQKMAPGAGTWLPTPIAPPPDGILRGRRAREVKRVGFIGNLGYEPNEMSLRWFLRHYENRFAALGIEIIVAGMGTERVKTWPTRATVLGPVGQVDDFYDEIDAAIVPIRHGGGIKVKAVEALLNGVPVIATPHVRSGFSRDTASDIIDLEDFLRRPDRPLSITQGETLRSAFSPATFRDRVRGAIEKVSN